MGHGHEKNDKTSKAKNFKNSTRRILIGIEHEKKLCKQKVK